jgi:hypothetical protein
MPTIAVDESIKTYWSVQTADKGEWIQTDLGDIFNSKCSSNKLLPTRSIHSLRNG